MSLLTGSVANVNSERGTGYAMSPILVQALLVYVKVPVRSAPLEGAPPKSTATWRSESNVRADPTFAPAKEVRAIFVQFVPSHSYVSSSPVDVAQTPPV